MYAPQNSQVIHRGSSSRSIRSGLFPEGNRRLFLYDWYTGMCFLDDQVKSRVRLLNFSKGTHASTRLLESISLKRPRKRWMHLWIKCIAARRLTLSQPLVSKCDPSPLLRVITRTFCRLVRQWWGRSHCPGSSEAHHGTTRAILADLQIPVLRIFQLPQFYMGADPILMSAIRWQGCHCSNHGGN